MLSARLILVRHGQSTYNAQARLQGQADPPLSDAGRAEAELLQPALGALRGRPRAHQRPAARERDRGAARLPGRAPRRALPRDRRRRVGGPAADGLPGRDRAGVARRSAAGARRRVAGRVRRRASAARVDELVAAGGPWLVVCHGGVVRAALSHVTGADPAARRRARRTPASRSSRAATAAARGLRLDARCCQAADGAEYHRKFVRGAALQPVTPLASWGLCRERRKGGNRPAGNMGPPCRPVTPSSRARAPERARRPRRSAVLTHGLGARAGPRGRGRRVAQELLDRGDHRRRLLGRGGAAVQLQARAAVHRGRTVLASRAMSARSAVLGALALLALSAPVALADPAGRSTTEETIRPAGSGAFRAARARRRGPRDPAPPVGAAVVRPRAHERRSLAFFGQLTDPQIADEMSPARVDFLDPAGDAVSSSWRPQEAFGLQVFDQTVRNMNANRTSEVRAARRQAGASSASRSRPATWPTTSSSTRRAGSSACSTAGRSTRSRASRSARRNPCPGATPETVDALNAAVAARRYTGVADYDDYRGVPDRPLRRLLGPGRGAAAGGPYAAFPRYPGLLERAQQPFTRRGAGRAVVHRPRQPRRADPGQRARQHRPLPRDRHRLPEGLPVGRARPGAVRRTPTRARSSAQIGDPAFISTLLAGGRNVPPDPDRRILSTVEYKREIGARARLPPRRRPPSAAPRTASRPTTRSARATASS